MSEVQREKTSTNGLTKTSREAPSTVENIQQILEFVFTLICWFGYLFYCIGESIYLKFQKVEPKSVKGEIVLITGTGHGIGKELAFQYAEAGATVVGWDINQKNNDETIKEINERFTNKAHGYICDVVDRKNVLEVAERVRSEIGEVSILIVNAGIMPCHLIDEHTEKEIERIAGINIMQFYWLLDAFLPSMKKRNHGHIVGLSSVAGLLGFPNLVPYCASKFAVRGLLEALREELRRNPSNNIKTTTIYPYMVDTGLCKNPREKFSKILTMLPIKRVASTIIRAQRTNTLEASVPEYLLQGINILRLLPYKAYMKFVDNMGASVESDLAFNENK